MFDEMGVALLRKGWPAPIPLVPREKRPAIFGWERFNLEPVSIALAREWATRLPTSGIGLAAGHGLLAVDIDTDTDHDARIAFALADDHLGNTPLIRAGRPYRTMRYYRLDDRALDAVSTTSLHRFALYATTGQTVLFGIHPETCLPYSWPVASPLDEGPDVLPLVTLDALNAFVEEMRRAFPEPGEGHRPARDDRGSSVVRPEGGASGILRDITRMPMCPPIEIAVHAVRHAQEGRRHNTMVGAMVALVEMGLSDDEIFRPVLGAHIEALNGDRPQSATERVTRNALEWARQRIGHSMPELDATLGVSDWSIWP